MSRLYSKIGFAQYIRFLELQEEAEMKVRLTRNFRFSDEQVMERVLKIKERKRFGNTPFYYGPICESNKHYWGHYEDIDESNIPSYIAFKRCILCGITKFYNKKEEYLELFKELLKRRELTK